MFSNQNHRAQDFPSQNLPSHRFLEKVTILGPDGPHPTFPPRKKKRKKKCSTFRNEIEPLIKMRTRLGRNDF